MNVFIGTIKWQNGRPYRGILAGRTFRRGEVIFRVQGTPRRRNYGNDYYVGPRWLGIDENTWLQPLRDNPWWYVNHSCNPNAGLRGKVTVVAMRDIQKNEEVTIDYSTTELDPYWKMRCACGDPCCRGVIRSIQFLPPETLRRYQSFIPRLLVRRVSAAAGS